MKATMRVPVLGEVEPLLEEGELKIDSQVMRFNDWKFSVKDIDEASLSRSKGLRGESQILAIKVGNDIHHFFLSEAVDPSHAFPFEVKSEWHKDRVTPFIIGAFILVIAVAYIDVNYL